MSYNFFHFHINLYFNFVSHNSDEEPQILRREQPSVRHRTITSIIIIHMNTPAVKFSVCKLERVGLFPQSNRGYYIPFYTLKLAES